MSKFGKNCELELLYRCMSATLQLMWIDIGADEESTMLRITSTFPNNAQKLNYVFNKIISLGRAYMKKS